MSAALYNSKQFRQGAEKQSANLIKVTVQLGGIISANIYRTADGPKYKHGNKTLIAVNILAIALFIFAKIYYVLKNKSRDRKWNAMTIEVCFLFAEIA